MPPASSLKAEAESIIDELALLDLLTPYGDARVVGSVALDLIVKLDIDIHVLTGTDDLLGVAQDACRHLLEEARIREVRMSDYRERHGIKLGIDSYPGPSGNWSIDIWITDRVETNGFATVENLQRQLTDEHRQAIIQIKREFHAQGELRDGLSSLIYEAVLDNGVRGVEEFRRFVLEKETAASESE